MSTNLMRANRVAVKANGENFVASFYKTHKAIADIHSEDTEWKCPESATNKTSQRESFRQWVIENASIWNIDWNPADMRTDGNIRKANYTSDEELIYDAYGMIIKEMTALVDKCKYPIEFVNVQSDGITPMTETASGKSLATMGITDGKYNKSGNWAWANIAFMLVVKFKGEECYIAITMSLVSGQLKKSGIGITEFNAMVRNEIILSGLATAEELDPPKESKAKKTKSEKADAEAVEQPVAEDTKAEEPTEKPKKRRARKSKTDAEAK